MKNSCFAFVILVSYHIGVYANGNNAKAVQSENKKVELTESLRGSGLRFTPNKGQIVDMNGKLCPDVLYKGDGGGADIYLRKTGISYGHSNMGEVMHKVEEQVEELIKAGTLTEADEHTKQDELMRDEKINIHRVDMDFAGANFNARLLNENETDGYQNFYYAHCPNGITNVKQYNKVTYKNIYNNIDVSYYGDKQNGLKYDLIVQPHADPNQIKLHWKGAESIRINTEGNLIIKTSVNEFYESIPKVYQIIDGQIVDVKAEYQLTLSPSGRAGEGLVTFQLATYNPELPLVIDPWATYYGGSSIEHSTAIANDNAGNVAITGYTYSVSFSILGAYQSALSGPQDAFIVKFNSSGMRLWATFYGGTKADWGYGITADNADNIAITGETYSTDFPIFSGFQMIAPGGGQDAFVVKFKADGTRLWASYYGGSKLDSGYDIETDNSDNIIIVGSTESLNFPVLAGYQMALSGVFLDAFVVKFNPAGALQWATYYGGSRTDRCYGVATDNANNVIIVGETNSTNFPVLTAFQPALSGVSDDAFVVKFNPAGTRLWATYYGGTSAEGDGGSMDITTDNADNVIISGLTNSANFPVSIGSFQTAFGGLSDVFVVKFNAVGARQWATYYGGAPYEWQEGIVTDGNNNIYLLMEGEDVAATSFVDACSYQPIFNGGSNTNPNGGLVEDQIIAKFDPAGNKICATYMGGTGEDELDYGYGGCISISGGLLYITGSTDGGYPVTAGAFQTSFAGPVGTMYGNGASDVFIASMCTNICEGKTLNLNYTANTTSVCPNTPITFTPSITNSCDTAGYKYLWTFTGGTPASSTVVNPTVAFSGVGTHDVKLVLTTVCKKDSITKISYITVNPCGGITASVNSATICSGSTPCPTITASGSSGTSPYTYSWSTGNTTQSINPCPASTTTYTVQVTDSGGATSTTTATVTVNATVSVTVSSTNLSCNGSTNGTATANPGSGTSPFTYNWSNAGATQTITGLTQGNYTVTVTDNKGCTFSTSVALISPAPLAGQFSKGTANCANCGCKEWVIVNATGGTSPYTYSWPDGYVNRYKNQLCPGSYSINIADKNGCNLNVSLTTP